MILTDKENTLLMTIINDTKCFDRRDNTFLLSNLKLSKRLKVSASTIDRFIRKLKKHDLVRQIDNGLLKVEKYLMLSPKFIFISYTLSDRWFIGALYELQSIKKAYEWARLCRELNCFIDAATGEIKPFNWYDIDRRAEQYTSFDRCYRKKAKCTYSKDDSQQSSEYYSLMDADSHDLTTYDYLWIDSLNSWSDLPYNRNMQFYTVTPKNIYDIKLEYDPRITECIQNMIKSGVITARR